MCHTNWLVIAICLVLFFPFEGGNGALLSDAEGELVEYPGKYRLGAFFPITRSKPADQCTKENCHLVGGVQCMEAMNFALDYLNSKLPFKLGALSYNTKLEPDRAVTRSIYFVQDFNQDRNKSVVAILGAAESEVTTKMADLLKLFRIPQISYLATSPELSDAAKYPYFCRSVPSELVAIKAIVALLRQRRWLFVNVLIDQSSFSTRAYLEFEALRESNDPKERISSTNPVRVNFGYHCPNLANLAANNRTKVILVLLSETMVKRLLDDVMKKCPVLVEQFLWIGTTTLAVNLNMDRILPPNNVVPIVHSVIVVLPQFKEIAGLGRECKLNPWLPLYYRAVCGCAPNKIASNCTGPDGSVSVDRCQGDEQRMCEQNIKNALGHTLLKLHETGEWKYQSGELPNRELFMRTLRDITFTGSSGDEFRFHANEHGGPRIDGPPVMTILTRFDKTYSWNIVGHYSEMGVNATLSLAAEFAERMNDSYPRFTCDKECLDGEAKTYTSECWKCQQCKEGQFVRNKQKRSTEMRKDPRISTECIFCDPGMTPRANFSGCVELPYEYMSIDSLIAKGLVAVSVAIALGALAVVAVMGMYWNTPVVKAAGREPSLVLLAGIFSCSVCATLIVSFPPTRTVCTLSIVGPSLCLSLCYAAIFARIWRIRRLFSMNPGSTLIKYISGKSQLTSILILMLIELALVTVIQVALPPMPTVLLATKDPSYDSSKGAVKFKPLGDFYRYIVRHNIERNQCICLMSSKINLLSNMIFPLLLVLVSVYYAFRIRKVPCGFNEAKALNFVNYSMVIGLVATAGMMLLVRHTINDSLPLSAFLNFAALTSLIGLFGPKMYIILWRPEKNTRQSVMVRTRNVSVYEPSEHEQHVQRANIRRLTKLNSVDESDEPPCPSVDFSGQHLRPTNRVSFQTMPECSSFVPLDTLTPSPPPSSAAAHEVPDPLGQSMQISATNLHRNSDCMEEELPEFLRNQ